VHEQVLHPSLVVWPSVQTAHAFIVHAHSSFVQEQVLHPSNVLVPLVHAEEHCFAVHAHTPDSHVQVLHPSAANV
jgi:hypothetical protein